MQIQNKTILKLALIGFIVVLFSFSIIWTLTQKSQPVKNGDSQNLIIIRGTKGEVQTNNFFKNPVEEVGDTLALAETKDYEIVYFKKDNTFLITLASLPVFKARDLAENEFMQKLGIDIGKACQLKVIERIPYSVEPDLSGKDFGLSFCPNAVSF